VTGSAARTSRREWYARIAVILAASLPYLRTVPGYFVQDDFGVVQLLAAKPWSTFPRWFTMPWMEHIWGYTPDEIRPFPALSYQITAMWGAAAPQGHHLLNVVIHAINGLLVLAIARSVTGLGLGAAAVAAVTFVLLPCGAESVAWITGRVDSMPATFYFASFLAYACWRQQPDAPGARRCYAWSLAWFFVALFSKQNTITMVAALVAYDTIVAARPVRPSWTWLRPYVPFAAMTAGFLALRYALFGEVLRERQLSSQRVESVAGILGRHVQRILHGDVETISTSWLVLFCGFALLVIAAILGSSRPDRRRFIRAVLYFGVIWIALGIAPTVAAGYESPRHVYLAAAGWALVIGVAFESLWRLPALPWPRVRRALAVGTTGAILLGYAARLHVTVTDWVRRADVSRIAVTAVEREVRESPPGSLVIIGVPVSSWEWSMPFAVRPPYVADDLTARASIVSPLLLHCCRGVYWDQDTRSAIQRWSHVPNAPVVALHVAPDGEVHRLTDTEEPELRAFTAFLLQITSTDNLNGAIVDILRKLVAGRGRIVRRGTKSALDLRTSSRPAFQRP